MGAVWLVVVVWGVNNAAGKLATAALPPLFVGSVRFLVALVLLLPFIKPPFPSWKSFLPVVLVGLVASVFWALGTVLVRRLQPTPALKVQGCCSLVAAPVLLAAAFVTEPHLVQQAKAASVLVWGSLVYAGAVSSVMATVALFWLVQRREAGRFTPFLLSTPLVSAVFGVAFSGDVITVRLLVGAAATLAGVAAVALAERRGVAPAQV